jgi:hypothetical protein
MRSSWGSAKPQWAAASWAEAVTDSMLPGGASTNGSSGQSDTRVEPPLGIEFGLDAPGEFRH